MMKQRQHARHQASGIRHQGVRPQDPKSEYPKNSP
jgi:hypothetical protein